MGNFIDLTGQKFGKLKALNYERVDNRTYWFCECDCVHKNIVRVRADILRRGESQSCGRCLNNTYEFIDDHVKFTTYNQNQEDHFLIDKEDFERVVLHTWYINELGYVWSSINKKTTLLHRYIMGNYTDISSKDIDHIFHDTRDNRKNKLRVCEKAENQSNKKRMNNNTGFKGVSQEKRNGFFRATIRSNYIKYDVGVFSSLKFAIIARVQAEFLHQGDFRYKGEDDRIEKYCDMSMDEILSCDISNMKNSSKKPVIQYDKLGTFIKEWESGIEASRQLNCNSQHIYDCCSKKRKTHKGYIWKYKEPEVQEV